MSTIFINQLPTLNAPRKVLSLLATEFTTLVNEKVQFTVALITYLKSTNSFYTLINSLFLRMFNDTV